MTARAASRTATLKRTAAVRRLFDRDAVRARLKPAGAYAAYALAYLDPELFPLAHFFEATSADRTALVMHARGGLGPSTLAMGDVELVGALLRLHPGPRQTFLTCVADHVDELLINHNLWRPQSMLRMQLDVRAFPGPLKGASVRRLLEADAAELNRLYAIEEEGLHYSGRQVSEGIYFGGFNRGRLVAAAGTHIFSKREGVAVIGNVFTHPDHRGRGLGSAVTAAVAARVMQNANLIVLNVDPANRTARHIYEQLGFKDSGRLVEAMATRRDGASPLAFGRRLLARWRSQAPGAEEVDF